MLKVALTHDVDRIHKSFQYFTHSLKNLYRGNLNLFFYHLKSIFEENTYWCFPEIIKIEEEFNAKSTYFFLDESIKFDLFNIKNWKLSIGNYKIDDVKVIEIIKWLDNNGWEIGLHGSYNSYKDLSLLKNEKQNLESILGHEITGIRQHYLNLNSNTWELQSKAGFKYDSSFGFGRSIGYKDSKYNFFFPLEFDQKFMVIPQVIMDKPFMKIKNRWDEFNSILDLTERKNLLLVINWHNNHFVDKEFTEFRKAYMEILKRCRQRNAKFYTLKEYYKENLVTNSKFV